jgi:hypothetical protein
MTDTEMKAELERLREQRAGFIETIEKQSHYIAALRAEIRWLAQRTRVTPEQARRIERITDCREIR